MKKFCIALTAISLLAVGCGSPEDKYVGKYTGRMEMSEQMVELMKGFAAMGGPEAQAKFEEEIETDTFELELMSDGTYTTTDDTSTESGTWRLDEESGRIYLSIPDRVKDAMDEAASNNPMAGITSAGAGGIGSLGQISPDITELGFAISEDGKVLTLSMLDVLKESGMDTGEAAVDMSAFDMKIIFTKQ